MTLKADVQLSEGGLGRLFCSRLKMNDENPVPGASGLSLQRH